VITFLRNKTKISFLLFLRKSHSISQIALNSQSCLTLPSAGIPGVHYSSWSKVSFLQLLCWTQEPKKVHALFLVVSHKSTKIPHNTLNLFRKWVCHLQDLEACIIHLAPLVPIVPVKQSKAEMGGSGSKTTGQKYETLN
jgi:hypothetical protein